MRFQARRLWPLLFVPFIVSGWWYTTVQHNGTRNAAESKGVIHGRSERLGGKEGDASNSAMARGNASRARILLVHKRSPDMTTGCDVRLVALLAALIDAGAAVTYLVMPVSAGAPPNISAADAADCVDEGERVWPQSRVRNSYIYKVMSSEPPYVSGVQWLEISPRYFKGPWGDHYCQRLAMLVHGVRALDYDAVIMPVWFWPFGGVGGFGAGDHHSLAHQVLPALRALMGMGRADAATNHTMGGARRRRPVLISMSDDAFSARYSMLARTESGANERKLLENASLLVSSKEAEVYAAVDVTAFISAEDRNLSFPLWRGNSASNRPELVLLRPSSIIGRTSTAVVGLPSIAAAARHLQTGEFDSRFGLVFLGSGGVATNYQVRLP
jgi:hypothetical protein